MDADEAWRMTATCNWDGLGGGGFPWVGCDKWSLPYGQVSTRVHKWGGWGGGVLLLLPPYLPLCLPTYLLPGQYFECKPRPACAGLKLGSAEAAAAPVTAL